MYSILVAIAGFGLIMYFFLPFVLGSLIFFEHKGLFFDKPLKQRKILISLFALIVGLIAISSVTVSFEQGLSMYERLFIILSSITYVSYTFYALRILFKLRTSKFVAQ
ncbi:hypothetical protein [Mammaliicoccus sciuri]|uniref:hypothetical protein n=1 Tax=Mammaliicoccus sciuri TaxID=1296 RepID=UPI00194E3E3B|nr:hypothetical protein [Mammaliicoccus sciuri]